METFHIEPHLHVDAAGLSALDQTATACCYAESSKHWIQDPQGIAWETYHTLRAVPVFGDDDVSTTSAGNDACCVLLAAQPDDNVKAACCVPVPKNSASSNSCCG